MITDLRCDFLVENNIVIELKTIKEIQPIFEAQVLTYMNLLSKPKGVLLNFNVTNITMFEQKIQPTLIFKI